MERKKIPWKNNLVISRFIRGLKSRKHKFSNISKTSSFICLQNSCKLQRIIAQSQIMHKTLSLLTIFWSYKQRTTKFSQKPNQFFNNPQTRCRLSSEKLCVLSLVCNSTTPLSAVFVRDFKFKNRQLNRKTFEGDGWVSLEFPIGQSRCQWTSVIVSWENILFKVPSW